MDEITFHQEYFSAETSSPKRDRGYLDEDDDDTNSSRPTLQSKRLRKIKAALPPAEKDRTRGRYACLGHRMKHKRCPLDCPDRRPKAAEQMECSSPKAEEEPIKPVVVIKNRASRSSAKKNVLKLEDCTINKSHPVAVREPSQNWDSVAWEGLSWDEHACLKDEHFTDLKSSSHWEESKHDTRSSSDDLTKFEEDDIIDSWLNEEFTSADDSEKSASDPEMERRHSPTYMAVQCISSLPKILLTKDMIERWINEPYFNRLLKGCLVRVQVGEYMGSPIHRIGNIEDVVDTCYYPYQLARGGQSTKGVSVQMGISLKKTFPILSISNQPPTEQEYKTWHDEMERSGLILDPLELQQKEEIVKVLHSKYPMEYIHTQQAEPLVNEPAVWTSC